MQVLYIKQNIYFISFLSVCFETDLFVSVFSILIRNTETNRTNRKNNLLVSRKKPKNNRNRLSLGLFRFEPKIYFVCFEDTLPPADFVLSMYLVCCTVWTPFASYCPSTWLAVLYSVPVPFKLYYDYSFWTVWPLAICVQSYNWLAVLYDSQLIVYLVIHAVYSP
jgi:hypothetical protein